MNTDVTITSRGGQGAGEYRAKASGYTAVGRLTWVEADGIRTAEHTIVPPQIGGRGVAARLVEAMVADAREHGFRIRPECSYVVAAFDRHPEWADIRA